MQPVSSASPVSSSSSASSRPSPVWFIHPFTGYNSLHAPLSNCLPLYYTPPYIIPGMIKYPTLHVPTNDPFYANGRQYVEIRRVGRENFQLEMGRIKYIVETTEFNFVTIDMEYPGTVYPTNGKRDQNPLAQYSLMKRNVDTLSLIQVGITLSDDQGNLYTWGPCKHVTVWEFVISDFDLFTQQSNINSIRMLMNRGLNFPFHKLHGISSLEFAQMLRETGLVWERPDEEEGQSSSSSKSVQERVKGKNIGWITFHGAYDFAYLIKALTNSNLPDTLEEFNKLMRKYFGTQIYDVKQMLRLLCREEHEVERNKKLRGGLDLVAGRIMAFRIMGVGNQSGSDSLSILMVFKQLKNLYDRDDRIQRACEGFVYPLV